MRKERFRFDIIMNILVVLITVGVFAVTTTAGYLSLKILSSDAGLKATVEEIWYGPDNLGNSCQSTDQQQ